MQKTQHHQKNKIVRGRYAIDADSSSVTVTTRHMFGLARVRGTFGIRCGTVEITGPVSRLGLPGEARCYAEIDAASFRTGNPQRDASVRSARLLDAGRYPVITFASQRLDGANLAGQLTVRGLSMPVVVEVEQTGAEPGAFTARGSLRVDRTAFGVTAYRGLAARHLDLTVEVRCVSS